MNEQSSPKLILVHGAWHGAWCWAPLEPRLAERGVDFETVELTSQGWDPLALGDLYSDAQVVRDAASSVGGPVVLLGHSYGGLVISQAAERLDNVAQLIYLTAFLPELGESLTDIVGPWVTSGVADISWLQTTADGLLTVAKGRARDVFYNDCDAEVIAEAEARLRPQSGVSFQQQVDVSPRLPSLYIVCNQDLTIPVAGQMQLAERAGRICELSTGHCPFLSQPEQLSDLLAEQLSVGSPVEASMKGASR